MSDLPPEYDRPRWQRSQAERDREAAEHRRATIAASLLVLISGTAVVILAAFDWI